MDIWPSCHEATKTVLQAARVSGNNACPTMMFGPLQFRHGVLLFQREHGSLLQKSLDFPTFSKIFAFLVKAIELLMWKYHGT